MKLQMMMISLVQVYKKPQQTVKIQIHFQIQTRIIFRIKIKKNSKNK